MNWMKFRPIYFFISGIALSLSVYAIFVWGFKPSIDFTGGSIVSFQFENVQGLQKLQEALSIYGVENTKKLDEKNFEFSFPPSFSQKEATAAASLIEQKTGQKPNILKFETVGPTLSSELLQKTFFAVVLGAAGILLWVAWQFKNVGFGVCAILALIHDLTILLGAFAILGHFKGVEVDILVVTAVLTTMSLSLYDTIVVFDRIRESSKKGYSSFVELVNRSITETIVRSFNTSITTVFVLLSLFLFGGESIKWFVFALIVGVITGTYSSPFVAVPLLVFWDRLRKTERR